MARLSTRRKRFNLADRLWMAKLTTHLGARAGKDGKPSQNCRSRRQNRDVREGPASSPQRKGGGCGEREREREREREDQG
jgi:hypothetical protein